MALRPNLSVVKATDIRNVRRRPRRPQHKFNLVSKPYQIVPFMIAPVLPGETMQNLLLQSRVVSDPIKNRLIGWHKEYYFFYVPHLAFGAEDGFDPDGLLKAMVLDPTTDVSNLQNAEDNLPTYAYAGGMSFVDACLSVVTKEFFRNEDDPYIPELGAYPPAQIDQQQWFNSIKQELVGTEDPDLPGIDEMEDMNVIPGFETAYAQWEIMRDAGMVDVDYDDFIRSYGVSVPKSQEVDKEEETRFRPELIRFSRSWTYPSNTIDPTDGSATSAVSWSIAERADKKRFFKYPGFIFGVTVTRPKVYLGNQYGSAVGLLNDAYSWLPGVLYGQSYTSVRQVAGAAVNDAGIVRGQSQDVWIDVKDLFLYGDQFINHAPTVESSHALALPDGDAGLRFPTEAMVNELFVGPLLQSIREDGVVHLNILGRLSETTP